MDQKNRERLELERDKLKSIVCHSLTKSIVVVVPTANAYRITSFLTDPALKENIPVPYSWENITKVREYANKKEERHRDLQEAINYIIDNVLKLEEHPDVQSFRLSGAELSVGKSSRESGILIMNNKSKKERLHIIYTELADAL